MSYKNEKLVKFIEDFKRKPSSEGIAAIANVLRNSQLYAVALWDKEPEKDEKGQLVFSADTQLQLMIVQDAEGNYYFPMFTELEKVQFLKEGQKALLLSFEQMMSFIEMAKDHVCGILVDQKYPIETKFLQTILHMKFKNLQTNTIRKGDHFQVREPFVDISEMQEALQNVCSEIAGIRSVYIKERLVKGKPSHWLFIVEADEENPLYFQTIGKALIGKTNNKELEFIFSSAKVAQEMIQNSEPIYIR